MESLRALVAVLVPPLCAACGRLCQPGAVLCPPCCRRLREARPLRGAGPPGLDRAWSSAPHAGVARDLVAALKFRRLLPVAGVAAERIHAVAPGDLLSGTLVPVPTAPWRGRWRGFDPAAEIAAALGERAGLPVVACLRRRGSGRQVGRGRARRLGDPPRIEAAGDAPRSALLIDDVLTTGATLSACARALRAAGATRVAAITFTRRL